MALQRSGEGAATGAEDNRVITTKTHPSRDDLQIVTTQIALNSTSYI